MSIADLTEAGLIGQTHVRRIYEFMEDGEKSEPFLGLGHVAKKQ